MVVRMRHTRAHSANRRSHHALVSMRLSVCKDCGMKTKTHMVCMNCGKYNGRQVIDVLGKLAKKEKKAKSAEKVAAK